MDIPTLRQVLNSTREETFRRHRLYLNPDFVPMLQMLNLERIFVKARGCRLWDDAGREYLDFNGNFGAVAIGHNHPRLVAAVKDYLEQEVPTFCRAAPGVVSSALAEALAPFLPGDLAVTYLCQTGAEAVEGGLKLARAATGRGKFLSTTHCYHGKTFGPLSLMEHKKENECFAPLLPGCENIPFGDTSSLEQKLRTKEFAAFVVEPIQSHGGVNVPPPGYLQEANRLCRRNGTLFFVDEIATGFGRTGLLFASSHWNLEPDIMAFGKGLSGGLVPVAAYATSPSIWKRAYGHSERYLLHSSTFGENNFGSAVALATLHIIVSERMAENAAAVGDHFIQELEKLRARHHIISGVRGRGLLLGIEFAAPSRGLVERLSQGLLDLASEKLIPFWIVARLLNDFGILTAGPLASAKLVRLLPPLCLPRSEVGIFTNALEQVCSELSGYSQLLRQVSVSIGRRLVAGAARDR
jgi:putrescine aminotransferase